MLEIKVFPFQPEQLALAESRVHREREEHHILEIALFFLLEKFQKPVCLFESVDLALLRVGLRKGDVLAGIFLDHLHFDRVIEYRADERDMQLDRLRRQLSLLVPAVGFRKVFHELLNLPRSYFVEPHVSDSLVDARLQKVIASDSLCFQLDLGVVLEPLPGEVLKLDRRYDLSVHAGFLKHYRLPVQFFFNLPRSHARRGFPCH